jgi:hypothetical protein
MVACLALPALDWRPLSDPGFGSQVREHLNDVNPTSSCEDDGRRIPGCHQIRENSLKTLNEIFGSKIVLKPSGELSPDRRFFEPLIFLFTGLRQGWHRMRALCIGLFDTEPPVM